MPVHTLDYDLDQLVGFAADRITGLCRSENMRGIGLRRDGKLVAATLYEGFNGRNVWMHVAAEAGARWLVRDYLKACFAYPFLVCGCDRVSGYVNDSNAAAKRFDEHLGFTPEARLRGAAPDGGDVILYVMWKKDCRYV